MIKITNEENGSYTHCGVLEFSAEERRVYVPLWILNQLGVQQGKKVKIETTSLSIGAFVTLRPLKKDFVETTNPMAILEKELRNFACLTKGDCFVLKYNNKEYEIEVMQVKDKSGPCQAINIVEADLRLEFDRPLDMPDSPTQKNEVENNSLFTTPLVFPEKKKKKEEKPKSFVPFSGSGNRLDSKSPSSPVSESPLVTRMNNENSKTNSKPTITDSKDGYWSSLGTGRSLLNK